MSTVLEKPPTGRPVRARHFVVSTRAARNVKLIDMLATGLIRMGGVLIIAAVVGILVFIVAESLPLFKKGSAHLIEDKKWPGLAANHAPKAIGLDEYDEFAYGLDAQKGEVHFIRKKSWMPEAVLPLPELDGRRITAAYRAPREDQLALGTSDGSVVLTKVLFETAFGDKGRVVTPGLEAMGVVKVAETETPVVQVACRNVEGVVHFAAVLADGKIVAGRSELGEVELTPVGGEIRGGVVVIAIDGEGDKLMALTDQGDLVHWSLAGNAAAPLEIVPLAEGGRKATAMEWVIGENSLLVGFSDGTVEVWSGVKKNPESPAQSYIKFYGFPQPLKGAVTKFAASGHTRGFLAGSDQGEVVVGFTTSQKDDVRVMTGGAVGELAYSPKLTSLLATGANVSAQIYAIDSPHPEISLKSLFGKVWYEGYDRPEFSWQSSSGADSFEAKFSLTPLLLGTVKGAFYGLLFAIPIAIMAATYTSQFMHYKNRAIVKPTVEIMAAMPSVVVGFLAGLWLAPLLDQTTVAILLMFPLVPLSIFGGFAAWQSTPKSWRDRVSHGAELLVVLPAVLVGIYLSCLLAPAAEIVFFDGNFKDWIYQTFGEQMEQRNCIVIGLAMGFAVIPIIFTISEDALSNVPRHFSSGSLALGASRWQTATRVILPTASPGIFSAVMIGFGRAVGETMIVLMATGNTPIMSMSPFNGMRTLSANIAVEIPEAPVGGTHYRVLFVAAVLLFALTFAVNTAAEVVRQRLRDKYKAV